MMTPPKKSPALSARIVASCVLSRCERDGLVAQESAPPHHVRTVSSTAANAVRPHHHPCEHHRMCARWARHHVLTVVQEPFEGLLDVTFGTQERLLHTMLRKPHGHKLSRHVGLCLWARCRIGRRRPGLWCGCSCQTHVRRPVLSWCAPILTFASDTDAAIAGLIVATSSRSAARDRSGGSHIDCPGGGCQVRVRWRVEEA